MKFIRIEKNKIVAVAISKNCPNGYVESEYGELGQIMQSDGTFIDDSKDKILLKEQKIQQLSQATNLKILNGIDFTWDEGTEEDPDIQKHHYSLSIVDQIKIMNLYNNCKNGQSVTSWHYDGGECESWSSKKFIKFAETVIYFVTFNEIRYNSGIRPYLESLDENSDLEIINNFTINSELPQEYEDKVLGLVNTTLGLNESQ